MNLHRPITKLVVISLLIAAIAGCHSPYYADRGAATGGLAGAGIGALVGNAVGSAGTGAVIGAGVGALTGGAIGEQMDDLAAQNRAEIAAHLGRQVAQGAARPEEVVAMTQSGVDPRLIINYINTSGMVQPLGAQDVIYLHQQGVATEVIQAMQTPRPPQQFVAQGPPPIIIEERFVPAPYFGPRRHHHYYHGHGHRPRVGWGVSISN